MRLDELDWVRSPVNTCDWTRFMIGRDSYVNIVRYDDDTYSITRASYLYRASDPPRVWYDLDPITAQAVLHHLTQGGNDEVG